MAAPQDTAPDAWARYLRAVRALTPEERVRQAVSMSDDLREIARSGVRARHPDWADEAVEDALAELWLGAQLASDRRADRAARPR